MSWPTPQFLEHMRYSMWHTNPEGLNHSDAIQMAAFKCNDPGVIGYSVCCTPNPIAIHPYSPGEDTEFYRRNQSVGTVWQYMPLDKEEIVVEIWKLDRLTPRGGALTV